MMIELIAVMRTTRLSILDQKQRKINFISVLYRKEIILEGIKRVNIFVLYKKEIMLKGIKRVNIFVVLHRTCFRREYMKE